VRILPLLLLAAACQQSPKQGPSPAASVRANARASASASAPSKAWFEGAWQGAFQAQLFRLEVPVGGVKAWKEDDGKAASGEGKLSFDAAPDGSVTGSATGALGNLAVSGHIDGERAALVLSAAEPAGFHGVILASQTPDGMQGTLSASSGDSLQARQGSVAISRAGK
jgi:hypothetical protein